LPFAVQAILQDMRSVPSAPDLAIFLEVSFGLAPREAVVQPASLIWNEAPHGPFGYERFAVMNKPSMSWWTMKWPASGELLPSARLHSHYARHHRLFLIDDAPQNMGFFASHVNGIEYVHDSIPPTSGHETMILSSLSHTEQTLSRLPNIICQDDSTMPSFITAATHGHPNASFWARRRDFMCAPHTLVKGRISTFVQLYRPVAEPDVTLYPMHTDTWFYVRIPGASTSSDIKTVSYRYATYRSGDLSEPFQNEAFGRCGEGLSLNAIANYVVNSAAGLHDAVAAQHAVDDDAVRPRGDLVGEAEDSSISVLNISASLMACLFLFGLQRMRVARAPTLL